MQPATFQIPAAIILLAGGLVACCLGYRLFRVLLVLCGFVGGGVVTLLLLDDWQGWHAILAALAGGVVGAVALMVAYLAGVALLGAALGAVIVRLFWPDLATGPSPWVIFGACLTGAVTAVFLRRYVIIVGTSFGGAWTAIVGGLALTGHPAAAAVVSGDVWQIYPMAPAGGQVGFAVGWIGLGLASVVVQLGATTRKGERRGKRRTPPGRRKKDTEKNKEG